MTQNVQTLIMMTLRRGRGMDARELDHRIQSLYGEIDWRAADGVVQVVAIDAVTGAVLAIGPGSPASETDRFILGLARARADFILTTGSVLRAEPELTHVFSEDQSTNHALREWRERICERQGQPKLIVVSYSGDIPLDHPALRAADAGMIWTSQAGHRRLGSSVGPLTVEEDLPGTSVDARTGTAPIAQSLARLINVLRRRPEARTILIEAGPTLSGAFYHSPPANGLRLDELLLSRFAGDRRPEIQGPGFAPMETIEALFPDACTRVAVREPSGLWHFERHRAATRT